ncbi:MAG: aminopeptidase P family protein [Chloroflexi bacterium]|nr:aminopeptidase P family protein [Chloroflexota bacterium]
MVALGLDWLLVGSPHNRRYLSGFTGSDGYLLVSAEQALLATDFRYYEQVEQQAPDFALAQLTGSRLRSLASILQQVVGGEERLGFEAEHLTVSLYETLQVQAGQAQWIPTRGLVEGLRAIKDEAELAAIRQAVRLTDEALEAVAAALRPGHTERQVAWYLERHMREHGAEGLAFEIIVGSGPNGARPHATISDRPLQAGEPIVIDMGCRVDGYCADLTRTLVLGQPDSRFQELYAVVLQAQEAAERGLRAGVSGQEADALARSIISEAGYAEQFGHSLGHGVGLEVHEMPSLSALDDTNLPPGAVVTVEPGIYVPGWGGIRIEDMGVVQPDGFEIFTGCSKEPRRPL